MRMLFNFQFSFWFFCLEVVYLKDFVSVQEIRGMLNVRTDYFLCLSWMCCNMVECGLAVCSSLPFNQLIIGCNKPKLVWLGLGFPIKMFDYIWSSYYSFNPLKSEEILFVFFFQLNMLKKLSSSHNNHIKVSNNSRGNLILDFCFCIFWLF